MPSSQETGFSAWSQGTDDIDRDEPDEIGFLPDDQDMAKGEEMPEDVPKDLNDYDGSICQPTGGYAFRKTDSRVRRYGLPSTNILQEGAQRDGRGTHDEDDDGYETQTIASASRSRSTYSGATRSSKPPSKPRTIPSISSTTTRRRIRPELPAPVPGSSRQRVSSRPAKREKSPLFLPTFSQEAANREGENENDGPSTPGSPERTRTSFVCSETTPTGRPGARWEPKGHLQNDSAKHTTSGSDLPATTGSRHRHRLAPQATTPTARGRDASPPPLTPPSLQGEVMHDGEEGRVELANWNRSGSARKAKGKKQGTRAADETTKGSRHAGTSIEGDKLDVKGKRKETIVGTSEKSKAAVRGKKRVIEEVESSEPERDYPLTGNRKAPRSGGEVGESAGRHKRRRADDHNRVASSGVSASGRAGSSSKSATTSGRMPSNPQALAPGSCSEVADRRSGGASSSSDASTAKPPPFESKSTGVNVYKVYYPRRKPSNANESKSRGLVPKLSDKPKVAGHASDIGSHKRGGEPQDRSEVPPNRAPRRSKSSSSSFLKL